MSFSSPTAAQNPEAARSSFVEAAKHFLKQFIDVDLSKYDSEECAFYDGVVTVDFEKYIQDPGEAPFHHYNATARVFIDKSNLAVFGYLDDNRAFENRYGVHVDDKTVQAVIDFISAKDPHYGGFGPERFERLFRLETRETGAIYVIDVIAGPVDPKALYIGGGYQFYVRKSDAQVLGFLPTF